MIENVVEDTYTLYRRYSCSLVVQKASWPDEKIVKGTLNDISDKVNASGIKKTAIVPVGNVLDTQEITPSKLYDRSFTHKYRNGE